MTNVHHSINYIEFTARDLNAIKAFYSAAFGWEFQDWGDDYVSFTGAEIEGGFERVDRDPDKNGALVILYSENLEQSEADVKRAGGNVTVPIFAFPGGRRFHFEDPAGNVLAIWSEKEAVE